MIPFPYKRNDCKRQQDLDLPRRAIWGDQARNLDNVDREVTNYLWREIKSVEEDVQAEKEPTWEGQP